MMSTSEQDIITQLALPVGLASPQAKLVYLAVDVTETATPTDLQQMLGLSKLALLSILESLTEKGHIQQTEDGYVTSQSAAAPAIDGGLDDDSQATALEGDQ